MGVMKNLILKLKAVRGSETDVEGELDELQDSGSSEHDNTNDREDDMEMNQDECEETGQGRRGTRGRRGGQRGRGRWGESRGRGRRSAQRGRGG